MSVGAFQKDSFLNRAFQVGGTLFSEITPSVSGWGDSFFDNGYVKSFWYNPDERLLQVVVTGGVIKYINVPISTAKQLAFGLNPQQYYLEHIADFYDTL